MSRYLHVTTEDVIEMQAMRKQGKTLKAIAERFIVCPAYVGKLIDNGPEVRAKQLAQYRARQEAQERHAEARRLRMIEARELKRLAGYSRRLSQEQRVKIRELWSTRRYTVADIVDEVKATWNAVSKYIDGLASEIRKPIGNDSGIVLVGCRVCNANIEYHLPKCELSMARIAFSNAFVDCGRCGQSFYVKLLLSAQEFAAEWERANGVDRQYRDDVVLYRFGRLV